jgi:SAM-dependent methyltransferase
MPAGRTVAHTARDLRDRLKRREHPWYLPPRRLHFIGSPCFLEPGRAFATLFKEVGGLRPTDDVLDIGCGIGRMAVPLLDFLQSGSRYEGFDVIEPGIEWCRREITPRHPNFNFQVANLRNERYNPQGAVSAAQWRFPYEDGSFDFAISTSVFTHLGPAEVQNYLGEAFRVLRPGGRLFGTWFLLGAERPRAPGAAGDVDAWFPVELGSHRVVSRRVPEYAIAFREGVVLDWHADAGFGEVSVEHGRWLGADGPARQDLAVAVSP